MNKVSEIGIDEVGRGAVFGPVYSAVVVLNKKNGMTLKKLGVKDSKKLTPKKKKFSVSSNNFIIFRLWNRAIFSERNRSIWYKVCN